MRGITVAYYATVAMIAVGLTGLLGYEVGWLFLHSQATLAVAGFFVPWIVFIAWAVSQES
jgi:hypothetical protein